ncbi:MAG: protein phosphatase CheZ [Bdellovibrionales bacterium]|nr:protein phosphatase CheZ [Bdellovibrionales bacterium]
MSDLSEKNTTEKAVQDLLDALGSGDQKRIHKALEALGLEANSGLYHRVGEMARSLHDSLKDFQKSLSPGSVTMHSTNLPDATSKLEAVIDMTFQAAETVLSMSEQEDESLKKAERALENIKTKMDGEPTIPKKLRDAFNSFYTEEKRCLEHCKDCNQKILISQNFQDLSGQSIKKVIKLVTELEENLINLLKLFGDEETQVTELSSLTEETSGDALGQDDADQILKNLGF